MAVIIPDWVPPKPKPPTTSDNSGQQYPNRANAAAEGSAPRDLQILSLARDSVVPILYGGPERMAGKIYATGTPRSLSMAGNLVYALILCEGPVESITGFEVDGEAVPEWVIVTAYDGSQTTVDPKLADAIPGFNETLNGVAYLVVQAKPQNNAGLPVVTALVKGLRVPDPRTSLTAWSDNPALCLAHYMAHYAGLIVDAAYTTSAANRCDETVTGAAGTEKRCRMTLALTVRRTHEANIDTLRQYIPAWVVDAGDAWRIVADMPRASDHSFGASTISGDSPPQLTRTGSKDTPNAVEITYTDTQTVPWEDMPTEAFVDTDDEIRRASVKLPGIRGYAQAYRFAVERLNHYTLEDVTCTIGVFDYGVRVLKGDVCTVSEEAFGWSAKQFRVMDARDEGNGRWSLDLREYDPLAYSGLVQVAPTLPDTALSSPLVCSPPTNFVAVEVLTPESNLPNNSIGTSIIYQSRISATWGESPDPYIDHYVLRVFKGEADVSSAAVPRSRGQWLSQSVQQLTTYRVDLHAVNTLGVESPALSQNITIDGKQFPPGDVPAIVQAMEIGGEVLLTIVPAEDFDTLRYSWRVDLGNAGLPWASMTDVDLIDSIRARFKGIPEGTHRFCVKALDSVGNESATERCVVLTVTLDENSFVRNRLFTNPTLQSMVRVDTPWVEGESANYHPRWVTNDPARSWDTAMPSPIDSGTRAVIAYGASAGVAWWLGETYDLGFDLTANFNVRSDSLFVLEGTADRYLEHSMDGVNWTRTLLPGNTGWTGIARFLRPYVEGSAGAVWYIRGGVLVEIVANATKESGQGLSSASTFSRVTLQKQYAKAVSIVVTPINTSEARFPTVDNVVIGIGVTNSFDVYIHKANGQQSADDYIWTFEGV